MIYTSYYAVIHRLPKDIKLISISIVTPSSIRCPTYKPLVPTQGLLIDYKLTGDESQYTRKYNNILNKLNPKKVLKELTDMAKSDNLCLLCYEKYDKFCHRKLVSKWLNNNGISCEEYKIWEVMGK